MAAEGIQLEGTGPGGTALEEDRCSRDMNQQGEGTVQCAAIVVAAPEAPGRR